MMCAATVNWTLLTDIRSPAQYVMLNSTIGYTFFWSQVPAIRFLNNPQNDLNEPRDQVPRHPGLTGCANQYRSRSSTHLEFCPLLETHQSHRSLRSRLTTGSPSKGEKKALR